MRQPHCHTLCQSPKIDVKQVNITNFLRFKHVYIKCWNWAENGTLPFLTCGRSEELKGWGCSPWYPFQLCLPCRVRWFRSGTWSWKLTPPLPLLQRNSFWFSFSLIFHSTLLLGLCIIHSTFLFRITRFFFASKNLISTHIIFK